MFTSRAEYRLQLREDNADIRLTEHGRRLGVVSDAQWDRFARKRDAIARESERLKTTYLNPTIVDRHDAERVLGVSIEREYALADLLRRPGVTYASLMTLPGAGDSAPDADVAEQGINPLVHYLEFGEVEGRKAPAVSKGATTP